MNNIYIILFFIIIIVYVLFTIRENYDNELYGSKEALNGCDIYGCNIDGNLKLDTYQPIINNSSIYNDKCFTKKEVEIGNYYPEKNNLAQNYNTSSIVINTGLAVIKENVRDVIDMINNNKINLSNIEEFTIFLINTLNSLSDGYHLFAFKSINNKKINKDRIEYDIVGRYQFLANNKSDFLKIDKKLVESLKDLIIHIDLNIKDNIVYVNDMFLAGIYNIIPNN